MYSTENKLQPFPLEDWKKRERDIAEEERKQPHSVDTLSKDSTSKTLISKVEKYEDYNKMTDEEKEASYKKFVSENKKLVEEFGMYSDPVASQQFLNKNRQLITEHTSNYLVVWCIFGVGNAIHVTSYDMIELSSTNYVISLNNDDSNLPSPST